MDNYDVTMIIQYNHIPLDYTIYSGNQQLNIKFKLKNNKDS